MIGLCTVMMLAEIVGGRLFGSIALVADGLHMSTHAGALLLAALAYTFARRHADDPRFTFGTGKLGDLAGFTSAIILAMIALLIGYEAVTRLFAPVPIHFAEAIPIAVLGLAGQYRQRLAAERRRSRSWHGHGHGHGHAMRTITTMKRIATHSGEVVLDVFEDGVPPRFRLRAETGPALPRQTSSVETVRPDGARQTLRLRGPRRLSGVDRRNSRAACFHRQCDDRRRDPCRVFEEHRARAWRRGARQQYARRLSPRHRRCGGLGDGDRRPVLARTFGWLWMDPLAGIVGACVIASWAFGPHPRHQRDPARHEPGPPMADNLRQAIECEGDRLADLHLWRLGPGHLGAIVSVVTPSARSEADYRARLAPFRSLSHLTIEVKRAA